MIEFIISLKISFWVDWGWDLVARRNCRDRVYCIMGTLMLVSCAHIGFNHIISNALRRTIYLGSHFSAIPSWLIYICYLLYRHFDLSLLLNCALMQRLTRGNESLNLGRSGGQVGEVLGASLGDQDIVLDAVSVSQSSFFLRIEVHTGHRRHPSTCRGQTRRWICCGRDPWGKAWWWSRKSTPIWLVYRF